MQSAPPASWPPEAGDRGRAPVRQRLPEAGAALDAAVVAAHARELGVVLTTVQAEQLVRFARLLLRWNRTHNLTAITRVDEVLSHHLLDSLSLAPELPEAPPLRILDAGAGAGLPGIPLAIALPGHHFTLVDAVSKKCAFLTQARLELGLDNVEVRHARLEQMRQLRQPKQPGHSSDAGFDVITSRALGSLATLVRLTAHLLAPQGRWLAMKGRLSQQELRALPSGVTAARTATLRVPLLDQERHLVVLQPAAGRSDHSP